MHFDLIILLNCCLLDNLIISSCWIVACLIIWSYHLAELLPAWYLILSSCWIVACLIFWSCHLAEMLPALYFDLIILLNCCLLDILILSIPQFFCDKVSVVRNHRNAPLASELLLTKEKQNHQNQSNDRHTHPYNQNRRPSKVEASP